MEKEPEVSEEERNRWLEVFSLFDKHGNGTISISDLGTVMRGLGRIFTEKELQKMIADVDADGNGIVDFDEFTNVMLQYPCKEGSHSELRDALQMFIKPGSKQDDNEEPEISFAELRRALTMEGEALTDEELNELLNLFPTAGRGSATVQELTELMMTYPETS